MKSILFISVMGLLSLLTSCFTGKNKVVSSQNSQVNAQSLHEQNISLNGLDGSPIDLSSFKGKRILIVNTASKCGFTNQYQDLEKLHQEYAENLIIIGTPCNQFGGQEPGTEEEIGAFCEKNYGVTFLMSEKLNVKGSNIHPLFAWLTQKDLNGVSDFTVKWNFNKFLINEQGNITHYFGSATKPYDPELLNALK